MGYGKIPASAAIVFHHQNRIYVMDANGANRTAITFDTSRRFQHVALDPGRRYLAANYEATNNVGHPSKIVLFDLLLGRETALVPSFAVAGNGGVDWDRSGYLYFAGVQVQPYPPNSTTPEQYKANAGANEIWRVKADGTGLTRVSTTLNLGEADVAVHESGQFITYNAMNLETNRMELWVANVSVPPPFPRQLVFTALDEVRTVHDPELSPDGQWVVFSMYNPNYKNFPTDPCGNTAQDIYKVKRDGSALTRLSEPGPISILPDWKGNEILHLHMSDKTAPPWGGMIVRSPDGTELRRINDVNMPKWIP